MTFWITKVIPQRVFTLGDKMGHFVVLFGTFWDILRTFLGFLYTLAEKRVSVNADEKRVYGVGYTKGIQKVYSFWLRAWGLELRVF